MKDKKEMTTKEGGKDFARFWYSAKGRSNNTTWESQQKK